VNKRELIKKLKALTSSSNPNEAANAQRKLEALMKDEGISEEDLEAGEKVKSYIWGLHSQRHRSMLYQVIYKVYGTCKDIPIWGIKGNAKAMILEGTPDQIVLVKYLFHFYWSGWERELNTLFDAYIQKHRIFGNDRSGEGGNTMTDEEFNDLKRKMNALSELTPTKLLKGEGQLKQLEHKT